MSACTKGRPSLEEKLRIKIEIKAPFFRLLLIYETKRQLVNNAIIISLIFLSPSEPVLYDHGHLRRDEHRKPFSPKGGIGHKEFYSPTISLTSAFEQSAVVKHVET